MKNKKGNAVITILVVAVVLMLLVVSGFAGWYIMKGSKQTEQNAVNDQSTSETINQITQASSNGNAASLKIWVRDLSQDSDTKVAVPVYCLDNTGAFVADAQTSSATAVISVPTVRGATLTCYAFNSTFITKKPLVVSIDSDAPTKVIEGYTVKAGVGKLDFYRDNAATSGQNVSLSGTNSQDHFQKLRLTINGSNSAFPLAGFYLDTVAGSNVSDIDMSGKLTLFNNAKDSSTLIKNTNMGTNVGSRKDKMNYVFTVGSADSNGNNVILLEQNDYAETGTVNVKSSTGCTAAGELVSAYAMGGGYFKNAAGTAINWGVENDASPSSLTVSSADLSAGSSTFHCASAAI